MLARMVRVLAIVVAAAAAGCSLPRAAIGNGAGPGIDGGGGTMDGGVSVDAATPGHDAFVMPGDDAFVPGVDATTPPTDAWMPPAMDAWSPPPNDAWTPPNDAWAPPPVDAWTPPMPRTCDQIYSGQDGYHRCAETATQCTFVATLYYIYNCNDVCGSYGGTCISQHFNGGSDGCALGGDDGCSTRGAWDEACVCTHPP